ncbi:MAG TPA: exodeoxyribonuclease V subunit gamma, partial [Pseudonocardia sp.]|nr:exodeoxyribonuclease V subunit gamma [Pseudonocardia sp.]
AFLHGELPRLPAADVGLDELVAFLEHPTRAFLRHRAGLPVWGADEDPADALPIAPGALARWAVGDRLLRDRLAGRSLEHCRQAEWRRGELPPGPLGAALLDEVVADVEPLVAAGTAARAGEPTACDVEVALPDGTRVTGTVGGMHADAAGGRAVVRVEYSRLGPKHRVRAWAQLLALTSARPDVPWRARTLGRGSRGGAVCSTLGPVEPARAAAVLADLVELHREGMCRPLPLGVGTAHELARRVRAGAGERDALPEAARKWTTGVAAEGADDHHARVFGRPPDASVVGTPEFAALALRVWGPLLEHESEDVA